ncbi:response regulator [Desulfovibrio aerotolerans]|uniref:Response regulator n=1 Tax=Solidesulfovibrio aerotolerans TaxID=295255 RepID=A0A7C9MLV5_9BACT|nr:response regulator [Solidesulfovibrio aerotolerans]MYL84073.1 response regulator [Solidesulfovibrio aerotolerans]
MANILVTDDSKVQLAIIGRTLLGNGHCVFKADNGHDAIEVLKNNDIDVLITDIFMPEIDGIELIMIARRLNQETGIIAISGGGNLIKDVPYLDYVKQLGADFSFKKPVAEQDLLDAIEYLTE